MKIKLDVSSESSARQRIHMKNQALFLKDKSEKLKCCLPQSLFGTLRVEELLHPETQTGINAN